MKAHLFSEFNVMFSRSPTIDKSRVKCWNEKCTYAFSHRICFSIKEILCFSANRIALFLALKLLTVSIKRSSTMASKVIKTWSRFAKNISNEKMKDGCDLACSFDRKWVNKMGSNLAWASKMKNQSKNSTFSKQWIAQFSLARSFVHRFLFHVVFM